MTENENDKEKRERLLRELGYRDENITVLNIDTNRITNLENKIMVIGILTIIGGIIQLALSIFSYSLIFALTGILTIILGVYLAK